MKTSFEKETTLAMATKIAKLKNLAKRKKVKDNPLALKEISDSITEIKQTRLTFRTEQENILIKSLLEETKKLIEELKNKEFRKQLLEKTTLLKKTPTLTDILNKYK